MTVELLKSPFLYFFKIRRLVGGWIKAERRGIGHKDFKKMGWSKLDKEVVVFKKGGWNSKRLMFKAFS